MMTCSMPAATASSTAYWITGLSTSGSISFGCAFVAGRKRVPQPAAGKTAFRTRKGTSDVWGQGSGQSTIGPIRDLRLGLVERAHETPHGPIERDRPIEVGEVRRARQEDATRSLRRAREGPG